MRNKYFTLWLLFFTTTVIAQQTGIKGVVSDKVTKETLVGATVLLQGTTTGSTTDLDGNYSISSLNPGSYNLVISYISYKTQIIEKVKVVKNVMLDLNVDLEGNSVALEGVVISGKSKMGGSEISMLSSLKMSNLVVSGISSQQINRSQDRDASEVIRRVPGITIMDDRFVMVRGLSQRYNTVWLNNASTPSSEADVRAFSFDVIPSSMLENIMVFKSPAPDLPADFSGAAIKIFTKNNADKNSFSIAYSTSYRPGVTFKDFSNYRMSKYEWLGFDDGSRALPADFPSHLNEVTDKNERQRLGRELDKVWTPALSTAIPDQRFQFGLTRRFLLGKVSVGTINSLTYSYTQDVNKVFRADYQQYDEVKDVSDTNYYFNDIRNRATAKLGALSNWLFVFGKNQKIEFRNLYNHQGYTQVIDRSGRDNYGGLTIRSEELSFSSRNTFSGQLAGDHNFRNNQTHFDWTLGYSYADKYQPDLKRLSSTLVEDHDNQYYGQYGVNFSFSASPELSGRVYQDLKEHIYNGNFNFINTFTFGNFKPELKAGMYLEKKNREFNARLIGYAISNTSKFNWGLPFEPVNVIFADTNINTTTGIKLDETTNKSDSYTATNDLLAAYLAANLPFTSKLNLYSGVRMEKNDQEMHSYSSDNASQEVNIIIDKTDFFPSANLSYKFTEKSLARISYGLTINRPEFREIAPFAFYDFEMKKLVRGNPELENASISNYDLRYEYYPSPSETFVFGLFYKDFKKPIETIEINSGSGKDYTFQNALGAKNYGAEIEVRKSLESLGKKDSFLRYLKNFMLVANASIIRSEIKLDTTKYYSAETKRPMQGQSPYIVNLGLYYQDNDHGLMVSLLYNVIGKRIILVGLDTPDVYEMPRNVLDLTITKDVGKNLQIKAGIQDILNQKVVERQFVKYTNLEGATVNREQSTLAYNPGSLYSLGIVVNFNQ
ncbi:MAG: TonB-dependent receptor [Lentimicrobiaceae bacterium]|jgi:outer membrane receptor for ferrienterochelin and colicin